MNHPRRRPLSCACLGACLLLFGATAGAADAPMLDGFAIDLGLFANNLDADVKLNGDSAGGSRVDLNRDLGLDSSRNLPFIAMTWRPFERHEFGFNYYQDDVSRARTLTREITIRDDAYEAGVELSSKLTYKSYGLGYRYWAWIGDAAALGVGVGMQFYDLDLKLRGSGTIVGPGGSGTVVADLETHASTNIPDPYIGAAWRYQMVDWARLVADAGVFKANVGDVDATLYNVRFGVEFYPWENFGIVTQYMYNRIDADVSKNDFDGNARFTFDGAQVLARLRF